MKTAVGSRELFYLSTVLGNVAIPRPVQRSRSWLPAGACPLFQRRGGSLTSRKGVRPVPHPASRNPTCTVVGTARDRRAPRRGRPGRRDGPRFDRGCRRLAGRRRSRPADRGGEAVVLAGLERPPCLVSFSGGRDSSALLAVAVRRADREGLDAPVPITARFPDEETDEAEWQELVIRHVGSADWIQVDMTEELDLLGEWGTSSLARLGLRYPPNLHFQIPLLKRTDGGSLLSGAGGDELLVPHRWARAGQVLSGTVRLRPVDALVVGVAVGTAPHPVRMHQGSRPPLPTWLTPEGRRVVQRRLFRWVGDDPVRYDEHLACGGVGAGI